MSAIPEGPRHTAHRLEVLCTNNGYTDRRKAASGFEPLIKVLQTFALPLGQAASELRIPEHDPKVNRMALTPTGRMVGVPGRLIPYRREWAPPLTSS